MDILDFTGIWSSTTGAAGEEGILIATWLVNAPTKVIGWLVAAILAMVR